MISTGHVSEELDIPQVVQILYQFKALLYFSVCCPHEFQGWSEDASQSDKKAMGDFSSRFQAHLFSGSPLGVEAVGALLKRAFDAKKNMSSFLQGFRKLLSDASQSSLEHAVVIQQMEKQFKEIQDLLYQRDQLSISDKPLLPSQLELLNDNTKSVKSLFDVLLISIGRNQRLDPVYNLELRTLYMVFMEMAEAQSQAEIAAMNQQKLHSFQAAVVQMMTENTTDKMMRMLTSHSGLAVFLSRNLHLLTDVNNHFQHYLQCHPHLLPQPISRVEEMKMSNARQRARVSFRIKLLHEKEAEVKALNEKMATIHDAHQKGLACLDRGEHELAIKFFLASASQFDFASLMKAGEMFLKGLGCVLNPATACILFRTAAVCSAHDSRKSELALAGLMQAYEMVCQSEKKKEGDCIPDSIAAACLADLEESTKLKRYIICDSSPSRTFLRLGECYLEMYKMDLKIFGMQTAQSRAHFSKALGYLHDAWRHIEGELKKYALVYIMKYGNHPDEAELMDSHEEDIVIAEDEKGIDMSGHHERERTAREHNQLWLNYRRTINIRNSIRKSLAERLAEVASIVEGEDALSVAKFIKETGCDTPQNESRPGFIL